MAAWDKRDDMLVHGQDPFNAEPVPTALYGHDLTPVEAFYTRNHGKVPLADPEQWRLVVDGLVGTALRLCLDDLRTGFEPRSLVATLQPSRRDGRSSRDRGGGPVATVRDVDRSLGWRGPDRRARSSWRRACGQARCIRGA
jgi:sulfite oxidase